MKTDELIGLLAAGAQPVAPYALERRFALASFLGLLAAAVFMVVLYGVRPDLGLAMLLPMFWLKFGFAAALAAAAVLALLRLARPGMSAGYALALVALPPLLLWSLALVVLAGAAPQERVAMVMGDTWRSCAADIALLSLPVFAAVLWGLRRAAPTRLRLTGACAGLLAGSLATLAYSLHCAEMRLPFLAVWYVLGIALPAALGALIGPRALRW
ncbi:MAG: NrsF family protein [Giesbergeria sp.]